MRKHLRLGFVLLLVLVLGGAIWSSQSEKPTGLQTGSNLKSVVLVVDFGENRPALQRKLTLAKNATGWDVLVAAKLEVQGTAQFPTGFVCKIMGWPADQDCLETPSYASGHWAYFVTNPDLGKGWFLSGEGAARHVPSCGNFEGWSWVAGSKPATAPHLTPTTKACGDGQD